MTREEARKAAEVMLAYADGRDIEYKIKSDLCWMTFRGDDNDRQLCFDFNKCEYRIKKEPTYRPFKNKEECWAEMRKHQPFGWIKHKKDGYFSCLTFICDETDFISFYEKLTFADGTPFGVKEG